MLRPAGARRIRDNSQSAAGAVQARSPLLPASIVVVVYAVLLLIIPSRLIVGPIGAPGTPANLLAIACLLWWLCAVTSGLVVRRGLSPLRVTLGIFAGMVLVSYAAGHVQGWYQPADIHQRTDRLWESANVPEVTAIASSAADRGLLAFAGWAGIALVTSEGIRGRRELERVVTWIVGAATVVAGLAIGQYFTGLNLAVYIRIPGLTGLLEFGEALSRSELNRVVATSAHPIELGVVMASILPLALHVGLHAKRVIAWLPALLIGAAVLMSVSRSAIVVAGVALLVLFLGWPPRRRLFALLALPIIAVVGRAVLPGLLGTIRALFTNLDNDPSVSGRTDDYELAFRMIEDRPLFGQGLFTWVPMVYRTIDNQGLMLLLEIGILGTLALVLVALSSVFNCLTPRFQRLDARDQHLGLVVAASLLGILSSYLTFDALSFRQVAGLTFLFIGLSGAVWHVAQDSRAAGGRALTMRPIAPV